MQECYLYFYPLIRSPDFNPAECAFSKVKGYLKQTDEVLQVVHDINPIIRAAFENISDVDCQGWANHYGYGEYWQW